MLTSAMVFAAGLGTRMRPLTLTTPKPLVNVCGKPILDYTLEALENAGVQRAVINTHHLAEHVLAHLKKRKNQLEIITSFEPELLETGGTIVAQRDHFEQKPFFSINGDVIWIDREESTLKRLADHWNPEIMDALLLLHPVAQARGYEGKGDFERADDGTLLRNPERSEYEYVFTGVQILSPRWFEQEAPGIFSLRKFYERAHDAKTNRLNRVHGLVHTGDWLHIGDLKGLEEAEHFLAARSPKK